MRGIIPTPGVAFLVRELCADGGIVISASHNPPEYNGIKFFDGQGFKLPDAVEESIEAFVEKGGPSSHDLPRGDEVGVVVAVENACELYIDHAVEIVREEGISFEGMKIALDTGHGAASFTTQRALEELGAEVIAINDDFTGTDINVKCGSTHLDPLKNLVAATGASIGIAHDGDADRVMFVDENGGEIDGDVVEAVCALDLKDRGMLPSNTVVSTVMCNLGFVRCMEEAGIDVIQTQVGDRYVLGQLRAGGYALGGEQSGHMIFLRHNSTGDGLVTACQFLSACVRHGRPVSETASVMKRFPQELINVQVRDKAAALEDDVIAAAIRKSEEELASSGRILVRPSGTEPLVRVMVEAATHEEAHRVASAIAAVVEKEQGV